MTPGWIINAVLTFVIIFHRLLPCQPHSKKTRNGESSGLSKTETISVLRYSQCGKTGLFINNNPVIDMDLRVQDLNNGKKRGLWKSTRETVLLITLDARQVGVTYEAKTRSKKITPLCFVRDINDKPKLTSGK